MPVKDYNADPDLNSQISGINIAEGCAPSGINNAIRQLMADVKAEKDERDATQSTKDAEQDAAINAAQSSADAAQSSADAAQSSADAAQSRANAAQSSADAKLPLAGGTMKNTIKTDAISALLRSEDASRLEIIGGTGAESGRIVLYGKDSNYPSECRFIAGSTVFRVLADGQAFLRGISLTAFAAPNYNAGVNISTTSYTAPKDGWIRFTLSSTIDAGSGGSMKVEDITVALLSTNSASVLIYQWAYVRKGQQVVFSVGSGGSNGRYFFPCVGAV